MGQLTFLSKEEFIERVMHLEGGHWNKETINLRWDYHSRTIELVAALGINDPKEVLEMGTMGISCVKGSDTIDYDERWNFEGKNPTYSHDARLIPWPIEDQNYEIFIALRVYQHLVPFQSEAVREAFRIAKKIIIFTPEIYDNPVLPKAQGLTYEYLVKILQGIHPNLYIPTSFGSFFYWDVENPSHCDLRNKKASQVPTLEKEPSLETKVKNVLKKILKKF